MLVQALNPLAVAFVGFGPALDLAGERGSGGDDVEAGFEQGEEEDVAVDAAGFEGDGGDAAARQPGDELPQSGRVGGELAHGVGAVGSLLDADPVAGVADVDAGGVACVGSAARRACALVGVASVSLGHAADRLEIAGGVGRCGRGAGVGVFRLRPFMDASIMGRKGKASGGGVGSRHSRPNGIDRGLEARQAAVAKRMGRKTLPSPIEPSGRA